MGESESALYLPSECCCCQLLPASQSLSLSLSSSSSAALERGSNNICWQQAQAK